VPQIFQAKRINAHLTAWNSGRDPWMGIIDELELEDMERDRPRDMTEAEILRQKYELVIAKTQARQFSSASRIVSSLGTLKATPEVIEKIKTLHPEEPPVVCPKVSPTYVKQAFAKEAIEKAILSSPPALRVNHRA
jgi:hypothetical protein